jgi:sarcosine oxidase
MDDLGVPLRVTRQVLGWVWPNEPARFELGRFPVWGVHHPDGSLSYGFPMMPDNPGLKMARHGAGTGPDPDRVERDARREDREEVNEIVRRFLPGADGPVLALRVCMYTNSPDGHFIIDRHPAHPRVTVACGFSGHGFKFASIVGEVLAELATEGATSLPAEFLGLSRFGEPGRLDAPHPQERV